jgi:GntR family transcriptional regulator/MocR family aminotransferase
MRRVYGARRDTIVRRLDKDLAAWLEPQPAEAGLHITAVLRDGLPDDRALAIAARRVGVAMQTLSLFSVSSRTKGLVLGYGPIPTERIDDGLDRLLQTLERSRRSGSTAG